MGKSVLKNLGITNLVMIVITFCSAVSILVACIILNEVIESHDEEMIQVISGDIYNEINRELVKPVIVSQTMASDSFFKHHLKNVSSMSQEERTKLVTEYLTTLKETFGCSAAFLAVDKSKHYYTLNGLQKTLDWEKDRHDIWYKNFLNGNLDYELNVDTDEANHYTLTIFVNNRIKDYDGSVLGVCGIGLGMDRIQKILQLNEENYGIKINLVNKFGLVQVDTESEKISKVHLEKLEYQQNEDFILNKVEGKRGTYIITKYIPQFDWYLVIQRDSHSRQSAFSNLVLYIAITWVILLALLLTFIQSRLSKGEKEIEDSATRHGITSHSGLYVSMHLIDLQKDTIHELSSDPVIKVFEVQEGRHAKAKLISAVKKMTQKESLPEMIEFIRLSNLSARIGDKQAIFQEFLSEEFGWCKAYFMLVDSNHDGAISKIVFAIELIDEEKRREKHLQYLSETDAMTGLRNRGSGEKTITDLMAQGQEGMFCLLDADKFKSINDNFGHDVGDKVIKAIANCLKNAFRISDVTLRLGGDEFAAYVIGATNELQGRIVINRFFGMIEQIAIPELGERKISVSLGAAFFDPQSGETFTELYKRADSAAYISKKTLGNCFTFAEDRKKEN